MRCLFLEPDDPSWIRTVRGAAHDVYHLPAYVSLSGTHDVGVPRALLVEEGDGTMLLPLIVRPIPGGGHDATSPYGYPGPVGTGVDDGDFLREAFLGGYRFLRGEGLVSLFVRFHPILNRMIPEGVGVVVEHGDTVAIDLSRGSERIWRETRRNHRRQIMRSIQAGHVAGIDESWDRFDAFKRLYRSTMDRLGATSYYFFTDAYFDGLRSALGDQMRLAYVDIAGEVAAAGLFIEEDGIVQFHLSASDDRFMEYQPTKRMIHFVSGWALEHGDRWLHLGGGLGAADDALLHFKAGFSPIRLRYRTLRLVVDADEYRRLTLRDATNLAPSERDDPFPAYRRTPSGPTPADPAGAPYREDMIGPSSDVAAADGSHQ